MDWYLKQKQDSDIVVSASPEFLLKPVCLKLGVSLIASINDSRTGAYTGVNCHGEEKPRRFLELFPNAVIDKFYSDSQSDKPMALLAKSAFLVRNGIVMSWERK